MKFFDLMKRAANEAGLELTELQYEQFIKYMLGKGWKNKGKALSFVRRRFLYYA